MRTGAQTWQGCGGKSWCRSQGALLTGLILMACSACFLTRPTTPSLRDVLQWSGHFSTIQKLRICPSSFPSDSSTGRIFFYCESLHSDDPSLYHVDIQWVSAVRKCVLSVVAFWDICFYSGTDQEAREPEVNVTCQGLSTMTHNF